MQPDPGNLADRIRAAIEEDERIAKQARPGPWTLHGPPSSATIVGHPGYPVAQGWKRDLEHATRHDPARVLRQVAAHREIIKLHESRKDYFGDDICSTCRHDDVESEGAVPSPCPTLLAIAAMHRVNVGPVEGAR